MSRRAYAQGMPRAAGPLGRRGAAGARPPPAGEPAVTVSTQPVSVGGQGIDYQVSPHLLLFRMSEPLM